MLPIVSLVFFLFIASPEVKSEDASFEWVKNQGYPYRLKLNSPPGKIVCYGKVRSSVSRLIHVAACSSESADFCPSPDECKKSTGYNFKILSISQVNFKRKDFLELAVREEIYINLEHKEDELFNSVYGIGLKDKSGLSETSAITKAEFEYLRRLLDSKILELKIIDSDTCAKAIAHKNSGGNQCLKCQDQSTNCLEDNFQFIRRFIEGKKKSEFFLIANLIK
jgi:hypothetical protein